jgi:regulatory protein
VTATAPATATARTFRPLPRASAPGGHVRDARRKPLTSVRATAIRMLARREYARAELADRLVSRGAPAGEVTRVLDELEALGYLSDARYAQMLVTQKAGRYGKRAIAHALSQRRVAAPAAQTALAALTDIDEVAEASALWRRRFGQAPADERERARQVRFLMARGYSVAVAFKVLRGARTPDADEPA